ncbi:unnamed protein product [Danaus chrysippus]|uniref:(African queen) hypothetical protein n=1 Tax=Danaus chrysippus TaxID=151541 RepID=A0A8J2R0Z6_9NEOP|nr:unnamed protein product [Danaus chrysippus]
MNVEALKGSSLTTTVSSVRDQPGGVLRPAPTPDRKTTYRTDRSITTDTHTDRLYYEYMILRYITGYTWTRRREKEIQPTGGEEKR